MVFAAESKKLKPIRYVPGALWEGPTVDQWV